MNKKLIEAMGNKEFKSDFKNVMLVIHRQYTFEEIDKKTFEILSNAIEKDIIKQYNIYLNK